MAEIEIRIRVLNGPSNADDFEQIYLLKYLSFWGDLDDIGVNNLPHPQLLKNIELCEEISGKYICRSIDYLQ